MAQFIARRLLQSIPVLLLASIIVFLMIHMIPGDPAYVILGADAQPKEIAALQAEMGLDKPLIVQYGIWIAHVLRGDLGVSYINKFPVIDLIIIKGKATVELAFGSMLVAMFIAIPVGIISALKRGSLFDRIVTGFVSLSYAIPTFWLGILLVLVFALQLKWVPPSGRVEPSRDLAMFFKLLILPSLTLGIPTSAVLGRFLKASLLEVMNQDYIRTARSKGLKERLVVSRHAMRNAMIPVVTVFGLQLGTFLGGAVVTESIFDYPGIGRMMLYAIQTRDYTIVQGTVLLVVVIFIAINLLVDITYGLLDPRIRYN
jgi:peptide/nickel transport system permease protein